MDEEDELLLPSAIRQKASVTPGGEYAWRRGDVEEVIAAACEVGLACLGGQVQFQTPYGTCEAYWLNYDPEDRYSGESWPAYVSRAAAETLEAVRRLCDETDFRAEARKWEVLRTRMDNEEYDPLADLWFMLYFDKEPTD